MKTKLLILLIGIAFVGCGREIVKEYHENGSLKGECEFKDEVVNGLCKMYHENGELQSEIYYINGVEEGKAFWYYANGNIREECDYKKGKEEGIIKKYYETGELEVEANFKNGLQHGITKQYYKTGELKAVNSYKDYKSNGDYKSYYLNGNLSMVAYQENEVTIYYVKYDSLGNWIEENRSAIIKSEKDDIELGEAYKLNLELEGPVEDSVLVILFYFDDEYTKLADKEIRKYAVNNKVEIDFEPNKTGEWIVHGSLIIDDNPNRSITLNPRIFNVSEGE